MRRNTRQKITEILCALLVCACIGTTGCGSSGSGNNNESDGAQDAAVQEQEAAPEEAAAGETTEEASESEAAPEEAAREFVTINDLEDVGVIMNAPVEFDQTKGLISFNGMDVSDGEGIYELYANYIGVTIDEYNELASKEEYTEEELLEYQGNIVPLFTILAIDENRTAEDLANFVNETEEEEILAADDLKLVGEGGDCSFFEYIGENAGNDNYSNLREEFAKEYDTLILLKDVLVENMEFSQIKRPYTDIIGSKVSFETTDLDGNPVSSEDIFSHNEITMVNVWATWCHWCVEELPELEKINSRLAEKDCAIIGICGDAENLELIEKAKGLLEESGDTYLNLCPWEGWMDSFDMSGGWPTSFFVDRNGVIIGQPVVGANLLAYEPSIENLLDRINTEKEAAAAAAEETEPAAEEAKEVTGSAYNIYVVDQNAQPVEGAMVQFCTNDTCKVAPTDAGGLASFADPEGVYEVHVLKAPDGYENNDEIYKTKDTYSDLVITITKQ